MTTVRSVRVGDILKLDRAGLEVLPDESYRRIGIYSWGKGIIRREATPGTEMGSLRYFKFPADSLILSNIQAWESAVAVATADDARDFVCSNRFLPYTEIAPGTVSTRFLLHYFLSERGSAALKEASPGTQVRNRTLGKKLFEALEIRLPDITEQRRIADHLDVVSRLNHGSDNRAHIRRLCDSWLHAEFSTAIPKSPLGEVSEVIRGSTLQHGEDGEQAVGQGAVQWAGVDRSRLKPVDGEWASRRPGEKRTRLGDLLLNSTGDGTIGRACLVDSRSTDLLTDSKVLTIRTSERLDSRFLALFLRSPQGQGLIAAAKGASTTKQTELGVRRTCQLPIPIPTRSRQLDTINRWDRFERSFCRAVRLSQDVGALRQLVLPAARNEVFNSLR